MELADKWTGIKQPKISVNNMVLRNGQPVCLKCGVHSEEKLGINLIRYKLKRLYRVLSVVLKRLHFVLWGSRE